MTEQWLPIAWPSISGFYEVSDAGRVRRTHAGKGTRAGWIMTPFLTHMYLAVKLTVRARDYRRTVYVHDLVATAFIGPKLSGMEVNHRNLDKFDNRASNLEYVTRQGNVDHAVANGRTPGTLSHAQVRQIRARFPGGGRLPYGARKALAEEFGVGPQAIWAVLTGRSFRNALSSETHRGPKKT